MIATETFTDTLVPVTCGARGCDVVFGMTARMLAARREDGETWYCPRGHARCYPKGKTEEDKLRDAVRVARRSEEFYREQASLERRRSAAFKGQRTRVLNLIARGVCPVAGCRRNFTNVREHMSTQHPDFHAHEDAS